MGFHKTGGSGLAAQYSGGPHASDVTTEESAMLYYSVVFLVIALIAGALGFFGVAGAAVGIAKVLFFVFLVLFVISLIMSRRGTTSL